MSDDFFDKIDAKLAEQNAKDAEKAKTSETNRAFVKATIPRLAEIAERYAAKCKERGMSVNVRHHDYAITFELRYKTGQERSLVGAPHHDMDNKLAFEEHFPDTDGKRYKTAPMAWYDESNWRDELYEEQLKKMIQDFVFYADRFGGIA